MHIIQEKLLKLVGEKNIAPLKLREIGKLIDIEHPQLIKHHLNQLERKGLIIIDRVKNVIKKVGKNDDNNLLLAIPILGSANCGPAELYAEENIEGYLRISPNLLKSKNNLFAIRAIGDSMNKANINGRSIESGDYVLIESKDIQIQNKDYVLSIIDGVCNIKKFFIDKENNQITLLSESTKNFSPIIIDHNFANYFINGKVIQVIKNTKIK